MKKAYNERWVENISIHQICSKWVFQNLISQAQLERVKAEFPEKFYRPGLFVRIGLFLFTCLACAFFVGFISLFVMDTGNGAFSMVSIICALCFIFLLEALIKQRSLFHSGVDNALLYAGILAALTPLFNISDRIDFWLQCILFLALLAPAILRYADVFLTIVAFTILFALTGNLAIKFALGKAMLPFLTMALAAIIYFRAKKVDDIYYKDCATVAEMLSLAMFYLGGNYFVVREGNAFLSGLTTPIAPQVPFAVIFYVLTALIPLVFILFGLKKGERPLLITGLLAFAFSVFTYRYYFGVLTIAQGLTLAGGLMILFSISCIRFFQKSRFGITDAKDEERKLAHIEAVLASQYLGQAPQEKGLEFGQGDFGGGGSGSDY